MLQKHIYFNSAEAKFGNRMTAPRTTTELKSDHKKTVPLWASTRFCLWGYEGTQRRQKRYLCCVMVPSCQQFGLWACWHKSCRRVCVHVLLLLQCKALTDDYLVGHYHITSSSLTNWHNHINKQYREKLYNYRKAPTRHVALCVYHVKTALLFTHLIPNEECMVHKITPS